MRDLFLGLGAVLVLLSSTAMAGVNIIGVDNRRLVDSQRDRPFTTIVRVHTNTPGSTQFGTCSGSLVGRRIVLTAAHCVERAFAPDSSGRMRWISGSRVEVFAGIRRNNGRSEFERRSVVNRIRWGSFTERKGDWALLLLDEPLGDRFGWLGFLGDVTPQEIETDRGFQNLIMGSVPGDKDSLVYGEFGCRFMRARTVGYFENGAPREEVELIEHTCDALRGSSGSPIIYRNDSGSNFVAALHVASVDAPNDTASESQASRYPNLAVPSQTFARAIREWREDYP